MDFQSLWDVQSDPILVIEANESIFYANRCARTYGLHAGEPLPSAFPRPGASASFLLDFGGRSFHFSSTTHGDMTVLSGRDVSDLKREEAEQCRSVKESEQFLRQRGELLAAVLDQMGEGVVAADHLGRIVTWNAAATRITQLDLGDLRQLAACEILDWEGNPSESTLTRALRGEDVDVQQMIRHAACPRGVWLTVTSRPIRDETGEIVGAVAVFRDSTVQRQLTETLGHARDAALEATRLKSEFLANMSHEIRTPLNGIIGMAEILGYTDLDQAQREYLSTVQLCSQSLLSIVNDVLDFSKIEAGKAELAQEPFDLEAMVEESLELAASGLGEKPIEMYARLNSDLPRRLVGDPLRLRQILLNFLSNAIKFTSHGHVVVEVAKVDQREGQIKLRFSVHDSGHGVEPEIGERLFQPFSQGDSSSKRAHGGTGLGLVICRKLATMMGGKAGYTPLAGGGTTFYCTAWLGAQPECEIPTSLHDLPPLVLNLSDSGLRDAVQDYLQARGARVSTDLTEDARFLILDDEGDHRPLAEPPPNLRIIYLGRARPSRAGGYLNFLRKPLKFSRLLRLLREVSGSAHDSGRRAALSMPKPSPALKGRVLVAEDNPVNRRVLLLMLEKMGLQATGTENGREAAEAALSEQYDLVLMDCRMPVMDGHEATRLVRDRWTAVSRLPIIAVTANAQEGEAERCRVSGMDDYLTKPVTVDTLRGVVERWLGSVESA